MKYTFCCLIACLLLISIPSISQVNTVKEIIGTQDNSIKQVSIDETDIYQQVAQKKSTITLPFLNTMREFRAEEFSLWGPAESPYKDTKTFKLYDLKHSNLTGRLMLSNSGVFISYMDGSKFIRTYPINTKGKRVYHLEIGNGTQQHGVQVCEAHGNDVNYMEELKKIYNPSGVTAKNNGSVTRKYRCAIVLTGEFMTGNGNLANAISVANANLMDISAIFERELNIELYHTNRSPFRFTDPNTDPFDPSGSRTDMAADAVDNIWPSPTEYDIGHVFHKHSSGDGWATGGVARLGVVCRDGLKGGGWSGSFNNQTTGFVSLAAHEFGHMFSATHTWNGIGGSACDEGNHPDNTAYEIGSGTTIMSYNGLCDADQNIPSSGIADDYFHVNSLDRMVTHVENFTCNESEWELDVNSVPVANANPCGIQNFQIPRSTPFMLRGEGTDEDNDLLTYCWEQYNEDGISQFPTHGNIGLDAALSRTGPNFRSFPPTTTPTRYIPNLDDVHLNNNIKPFEALSAVDKTLVFRMTVRDNSPNGGGVDWDQINVNVVREGPLEITFPDRGDNLVAGEPFTFEWDPAGTEALCETVTISASFDGGQSYPYILATDVPYSAGSLDMAIPGGFPNTDAARLKIECADYECFTFYDVSDRDFTIESNCTSTNSLICDTEPEEFNTGESALNMDLLSYEGIVSGSFAEPLVSDGAFKPGIPNINGVCISPPNLFDNPHQQIDFIVSESGSYRINFDRSGNNNITVYFLHEKATFSRTDPCASLVASSHFWDNGLSTFTVGSFDAQLEQCVEYLLIPYVTGQDRNIVNVTGVSGPGLFLRPFDDPDFSETFVAISTDNGEVTAVDNNSDFRSLDAGSYIIRSVMYKSAGVTPPDIVDPMDWVGQRFEDVQASDNCFSGSFNQKEITVISTCDVQNLEFEDPSPCDPQTNTYSIEFDFFVDKGPTTGTVTISANGGTGQLFNVNDQNMNVLLENLPADGQPVDLSFEFSEDSDCDKIVQDAFIAPENCCPIGVDLGGLIEACENDVVELDGGAEGTSFTWFRDNTELAETDRILMVTEPGDYRVISDNGNCTVEDEVVITYNAAPTLSAVADVMGCDGNPEFVSVSSSADSIAWLLDNFVVEANSDEYGVTESGNYTIVAVNEFGCETIETFVGTFAVSPIVDLGSDESLCEGTSKVLDGGSPDNTYEWKLDDTVLPENGNTIDALDYGSGEYSVVVTNPGNCSTRDTVIINYRDLPDLDLGPDIVGCEGDDLVLSVDAQGFVVEWLVDNDPIVGEDGDEIIAETSGVYEARVSAGAGCETSTTVTVTYESRPVVDLGEDRSECPDMPVELNGGDPNNTYEWSSDIGGILAETSNILSVDVSDTYYVRSTNAADCETLDTVTITFTDLPIIDLGDDLAGCEGDDFQLSFDPSGFVVIWLKDDAVIVGENTGELTTFESGEYIAVVESGPDCQVSDTINVSYTPRPIVDLGDDRSACPDNPVPLDAGDPSNTYVWSAETQGALAETSNVLNVEISDTYYVSVTNAADCSTLDTVTITFTDLPMLDLGMDIQKCEGEEHVIVANNTGFDIEWQLNSNTIVGETADEITVTESGTYTAVVSADPTCAVQDDIVITFNPNPQIEDISDASPCIGDIVELTAGMDGVFTYEWRRNGTVIQTGSEGTLQVMDEDGRYSVIATNEFMCTSTDTAEVLYLETPEIALPDDFDFCEGTTAMIEAVSNTFIEWYVDDELIPNQSAATIEVDQGGEYVAVVGAGGSCERRDTIVLNAVAAPDYVIDGQNQYCADDPDAILSVELEAGETAEWSLNSVVQTQDAAYPISESGMYSVVVTNQADCSTPQTIDVEFFPLAVNTLPMVPQLCEGDPYQMVATSDGVSYTWTRNTVLISGETGTTLDITESGDYELISLNEIGCETVSPFTVTFDPIPVIDLGGPERRECIGFTVPLQGPDDPGNTYVWTKDATVLAGETGSSIDVTEDGVYGLTVTNSFGCESSAETIVTFNLPPSLAVTSNATTFCAGSDVELSIDTDANTIRWLLDNILIMSNTPVITANQEGLYRVEVESDDGCVIFEEIMLEETPNPVIEIPDISLCVGESEEINIDPNYASYTWEGITATGPNIIIDYMDVNSTTTETASLTVVDDFNCSATEEFDITYFALIDATAISSPVEICEGESVDLFANGGTMYEWTDPNGSLSATDAPNVTATPTETTTYTVTVSDDCPLNIAEFEIQVIVNQLPNAFAGIDTMAISGIDFQLNATGGTEYQWDNRDFIEGPSNVANPIINISEPTTFTVIVTDENGCSSSDEISIGIDDSPIEAVTVITPNGDGVNDDLVFRGLEAFANNELTIFNRWGNVIFKKTGYQLDGVRWDGTRNGQDLPADTYYYILKFGDLKFKKSLTIIRQ